MAKQFQSRDAEIDLMFPLEGVNEERSFTRQRPGTTIDALNVRCFDPATNRARGSQRQGSVKYFDGVAVTLTQVGGSTAATTVFPIQDINHLVSTELPPPQDYGRFIYGQASGSGFGIANGATGASVYSGLGATSGYILANSCWDGAGNAYVAMVNQTTGALAIYCIDSSGAVTWSNTTLTVATGSNRNVPGMCICGDYLFVARTTNTTFTPAAESCRITKITKSNGIVYIDKWRIGNSSLLWYFSTAAVNCMAAIGTNIYWDGNHSGTYSFIYATDYRNDVASNASGYVVYSTSLSNTKTQIVTDDTEFMYIIGATTSNTIKKIGTNFVVAWSSGVADTANSIAYDKTYGMLVAACATAPGIRRINTSTGALVSTVSSSTIYDRVDTDGHGAFVAWKNSQSSNDVIGLSSTLGTVWGPSSLANADHTGASVNKGGPAQVVVTGARQIRTLLVAGGECRRFTTSGTTALTGGRSFKASAPVIFSTQLGTNMYFVDGVGYYYYKATTDAIVQWTATTGTIPFDSPVATGARIIENYLGSILLTGFLGNPQMWYMSRQLNPFDWDASAAATDLTASTNGNDSLAGLVGDVVRGVIPYHDDTAIFLCDHTIWQLTGHPRAGGRFDLVSESIGGVFGRAWAKDPYGQIYFMSNIGSIYKMTPGAMPQPISLAVDKRLRDIDLSAVSVRMEWDTVNQGLWIWVTPFDEDDEALNFFYEERTNAWLPFSYGDPLHQPFAVHTFDGDAAEDRAIMLGGRDGYLRIISQTAAKDDGVAIDSYVWIGPITTKQLDAIRLKELQATLGDDSGDVTWEVYVADTVEQAIASEPVSSGTWTAGRNAVSPVFKSGFAVFVKLSASNPFTIERIRARYEPLGMVRRRM